MDKEKPPFDGPYTKKPAATTDKGGAVHSPMSRARHLARIALQQKQKKTQKEEVEEGTSSLEPGWMLKADPKLGAAVKAKQDLAKKRQATYGKPEAGKQVAELDDKTVKSYAHKAIADTMQGKKDRNPGIKRAFNQLAGLKAPLMKAKNGMKEGAYSEKEIEDSEMAKNPGMRSYRKPAPQPQPEKKKEVKEFNFLKSFSRASTMMKDSGSSSTTVRRSTATKPSATASGKNSNT